ncbi:13490_t:CDS:2 [Gigaspora margarita]|uniref:13490_t:CDS:1 n=1 Tax=Gigaspora margarita TaxID=4874 RepID=A0ABN7VPH8_GIGMA|nr:13490_t:CDS:2 [Gigaspora margarita]
MEPIIEYVKFLATFQNSNKKSSNVALHSQNTDIISLINTEPKQITVKQELHWPQNPMQQSGELLDPRDEMDVDLTPKEVSVDIILEEGDSKNITKNQRKLYSQIVTGPKES